MLRPNDVTGQIERPQELESETIKTPYFHHGSLYVTIATLHGDPFEVFINFGGLIEPCTKALAESLARSISLGLRRGVELEEYANQFSAIKCSPGHTQLRPEGASIYSVPDAISKVFYQWLETHGKRERIDGTAKLVD